MHIKLSELSGRAVLDANGWVVGRIKAPLVDMETWLLDTLRVALHRRAAKQMGIPWSYWRPPTVDVPTGQIQAAGDAIILRVSLDDLRETPPAQISEEVAVAAIH